MTITTVCRRYQSAASFCTQLSRACLLPVLVMLLAGCAVTPDVPQPTPQVPGHYRDADHNENETAVTNWPSPNWWHAFDAAELNRLIAQARQANLDIAAATARVAQADAQVRISGAALLPSVDADGSASHTGRKAGSTETYKATLGASYEIDFWGKNHATRDAARASARASRYDRDTVALGVEASVATTYFTIVITQARLHIAEQNLGVARKLLRAFRAQLNVGVGTALDVAQQQTQVATQLAAIPALRRTLNENINALAVLLGKPPSALALDIVDPAQLNVPAISAGLPSTLLNRRPDIAQAQAQLVAARLNVSAATAALLPSFDLSIQGGWQNAVLGSLFEPASAFYSLAGSITQPLFEGGKLRGQLAVSKARYKELLADYYSSVINAFEDVDNALTAMQQSRDQEQRQQRVVQYAQHALDIAQARLQQGVTDVTTVLNTEQALFNARDTLARDRLTRLNAAVSLYQALGGGWQQDTNDDNNGTTATDAAGSVDD